MIDKPQGRPSWTDLVGMFWLAFATLVFELAYNKIVVVQNYGRLGYIVIGTALLGFAVSGVLLACNQRIREIDSERLFPVAALASGLFMLIAYLITSVVPLDFTRFFERPVLTAGSLACWYVALTLPFFFAGLAICSLLGRGERGVSWLYGADLIGAGFGAVVAVFAASTTIGPIDRLFSRYVTADRRPGWVRGDKNAHYPAPELCNRSRENC